MDDFAIDVSGLVKTFPTPHGGLVRAVDGVDVRIRHGEIVALLGPNGAGKTTMLDIVLGLTTATSGSVQVFGQSPRAAVAAGRISAVLQSGGLLADFTVKETVQAIASLFRDPSPVEEVMKRAGITEISGRKVSKCSGGQQQRLRFALALLPNPDLIVLDEPTAGMDVASRREFWETMRVDAEAGRTIVFATHYLEEADDFADRVVLIARGRIVADGPTAQVRAMAAGRTVSADFPNGVARHLDWLRALDGVNAVEERGGRVYVHASDSDAVARTLLVETDARNVEITSTNLEDAFVSLTSDHEADEPSVLPTGKAPR